MQHKINTIAIYCGSNMGGDPAYLTMAKQLALAMVEANIDIIYGGGNVGLMGVMADTALIAGGKVIGVIPQSLVDYEVAHEGLTDLHIVDSMHERKALMAKLADGFIMLPGGPGTWEEFFEVVTWAKLGYHHKPCGVLNTNGYYDHLLQFMHHAVKESFLHTDHHEMIIVGDSPSVLLQQFLKYTAPQTSPWIKTETV
jgi:uncharacterized protein (TIGR00730 family)